MKKKRKLKCVDCMLKDIDPKCKRRMKTVKEEGTCKFYVAYSSLPHGLLQRILSLEDKTIAKLNSALKDMINDSKTG